MNTTPSSMTLTALRPDRDEEMHRMFLADFTGADGKLVIPNDRLPEALMRLSEPRDSQIIRAKKISLELRHQAANNRPLGEVVQMIAGMYQDGTEHTLVDFANQFLRSTFVMLKSYGVVYDITQDAEEAEASRISQGIRDFHADDMERMATSLEEQYERFKGIRAAFKMMVDNGILTIDSVVPMSCLSDFFTAVPIWYVKSRMPYDDNTSKHDPKPDHVVKFFCDAVGSESFAHLFQIYNRRTRPFKLFDGPDIMPDHIRQTQRLVGNVFDYLVIATPYHDVASREIADPNWLRNIDPFLLGFISDLPYFFVLGRWSGNGIFPLFTDMVADTMEHLRSHRIKLNVFHMNNSWWHLPGYQNYNLNDGENKLLKVVNKALESYEQGNLFEFLRTDRVATPT